MLAQLDHAASCELYGAEAKNGETCSRASGFVWLGWGVGFMGTEFEPGVFAIFGTKNRILEGTGWVD
jgi:hypothetical protein